MTWVSGVSETRLEPGGPVVAVAYRQTLVQRLQLALVVTVVCAAESLVFFSGPDTGFWQGPLIFATTFTAVAFIPMPARTVITRDTVTVRRFGHRSIAWCNIEAITRKRRFGGVTVIVVHEAGGGTTLLPGLVAGRLARDPAFDAKYATITAWWTAGRAVPGLPGR